MTADSHRVHREPSPEERLAAGRQAEDEAKKAAQHLLSALTSLETWRRGVFGERAPTDSAENEEQVHTVAHITERSREMEQIVGVFLADIGAKLREVTSGEMSVDAILSSFGIRSAPSDASLRHSPNRPPPHVGRRNNGKGWQAPRFEPRLQTLILALQERGISAEELVAQPGVLVPGQIQQAPYVRLQITNPEIETEVVLCNQVGYTTYVSNVLRDVSAYEEPRTREEILAEPGMYDVICHDLQEWAEEVATLLTSSLMPLAGEPENGSGVGASWTWRKHMRKLRIFCAMHSEPWPRTHSPDDKEEESLAAWLANQRIALRDKRISPAQQKELLDFGVLPAKLKEEITKTFEERLEELDEFLAANDNRRPRIKGAADETEKSLARWVVDQQGPLRDNLLSPERASRLLELGVKPARLKKEVQKTRAERIAELRAFRDAHPNDMPNMNIEAEKSLAIWVRSQRKQMRDKKLAPAQVDELLKLGVTPMPPKKDIDQTQEKRPEGLVPIPDDARFPGEQVQQFLGL